MFRIIVDSLKTGIIIEDRPFDTRPPSTRRESRRTSPHTGFARSTVTAGGGSSPALRGF